MCANQYNHKTYTQEKETTQTFAKLYNHELIKPIRLQLRDLKTANEDIEIEARSRVTKNNETMKSLLLKMGQNIEKIYKENEMDFLIPSISENVISILEKDALEDLIIYAIQVLPDSFKNPQRSRAPKLQSQQTLNLLKEETEKNIEQHLQNLDSEEDLKAAYELKLQELKKIEEVAEKKNHSLLPDEREDGVFNQLNELDRLQEERFSEKAYISPPLDPIDIQASKIKLMGDKFQELIDSWYDVKKVFTKEYPPLTEETADIIIKGLDIFIMELRPYVDDKYRRDLPMWAEIAEKKYEVSATNASKRSAIETAWIINPKTGKPFLSQLTKEQIDSKVEEYIKIIIQAYKNPDNFRYGLTRAFQENGARCREDRRIRLHEKLSHLS